MKRGFIYLKKFSGAKIMKKQKMDEKFQELSYVSAELHHIVENLGEKKTFTICELMVNMALRDVVIQRGYSDRY